MCGLKRISNKMIQKKLIIKGYVQGVGYRAYVCSTSRWLKIKGTVKNLNNGNVEIICECNNDNHFEKFKKEIELKGTDIFSANVEIVEIEDVSNLKLGYFNVDYDDGGEAVPMYAVETLKKLDIGGLRILSLENKMITCFDTMERKYDTIGKNLIKLEEYFKIIVEELIGKKGELKK